MSDVIFNSLIDWSISFCIRVLRSFSSFWCLAFKAAFLNFMAMLLTFRLLIYWDNSSLVEENKWIKNVVRLIHPDFYYIHTEIYTLKSRRVNFRSQTDVNQSNVAYRFSHTWEKRYVQSGAAYHVFSRVSRTASWRFHSRTVGTVSCTSHRFASLKRANSFYSHFFHR